MKIQLLKFVFVVLIIIAMCAGFYLLGKSQAETKIVKEQIEIIKYENIETEKEYEKEQEIYSEPNSNFAGIVDWLRGTKNKNN